MDDVKRLLSIIKSAPLPFGKTDSQLAQEYRNWFYGIRSENLEAAKQHVQPTAASGEKVDGNSESGGG